jgi:hypothetical protein
MTDLLIASLEGLQACLQPDRQMSGKGMQMRVRKWLETVSERFTGLQAVIVEAGLTVQDKSAARRKPVNAQRSCG